MTAHKKESALGRGLDALIRPDFVDEKKQDEQNRELVSKRSTKTKKKDNTSNLKSKRNINKTRTTKELEIESDNNKIKPIID